MVEREGVKTMRERDILFTVAVSMEQVRPLLDLLEYTSDIVHLSKTVRAARATIIGVPAKRVDVLVDVNPEQIGAMQVVTKRGRFDAAERPRITLRRWDPSNALPKGELWVTVSDTQVSLDVASALGTWTLTEQRLRSDLVNYNPARLVMWHYRRYYGFLPHADVTQVANSFDIRDCRTLAEANRKASRELYRLARELGWYKLTLREKMALGLSAESCWLPESVVSEARRVRYERKPVVSEATLDASSGDPNRMSRWGLDKDGGLVSR